MYYKKYSSPEIVSSNNYNMSINICTQWLFISHQNKKAHNCFWIFFKSRNSVVVLSVHCCYLSYSVELGGACSCELFQTVWYGLVVGSAKHELEARRNARDRTNNHSQYRHSNRIGWATACCSDMRSWRSSTTVYFWTKPHTLSYFSGMEDYELFAKYLAPYSLN